MAVLGIKPAMCFTLSLYHTFWILIPVKLLFWLEMAVLGIQPSMCIHSPSTIIPLEIYSRKASFWIKRAFWESNFLCVYTLRLPYLLKFDPVKQLSARKKRFGIKFPMCIHLLLPCLWKFDSRKASFWLKRAVLGIKFSLCIHSPSTIPLEIWLP